MKIDEDERIDDLGLYGLKIIQNKNWFCFGMDSVVLSDFAKNIKKGAKVLDLGTGNGILPILLCGKTLLSEIVGVEIQSKVCNLARRNIELNNLQNRFSVIEENIKNLDEKFEPSSFDAVVTNPPYKKANTGIQNEEYEKLIARHEIECNIEDIARVSSKLLKNQGELYMVHRPERLVDIIYNLRKFKIEPKVLRFIQGKENKNPNLVLIKAVKNGGSFMEVLPPLVVYNEDGSYTSQMEQIHGKKE